MADVPPPILPIQLYRYRSLNRSAETIDQELDCILNRCLYFSPFRQLNDPMEGFYQPTEQLAGTPEYTAIVRDITSSKSNVGVVCFTEAHDDVLMWAHYANNSAGMCLSYSTQKLVDGLPHHVNLVRLAYTQKPPLIDLPHTANLSNAAFRILSQKRHDWAYEREWRLLGPVGQIKVGRVQPIEQIFFGSRVDRSKRQRILSKIQGTRIKAYEMEVNGYNHYWVPINVAARDST